jgi:hypothetical protein
MGKPMGKMFQIVKLTSEGPEPQVHLGIFEDGKYAAEFARMLSLAGQKFQVRPIAQETDWRAREQHRFKTGEYKPLPWAGLLEPIPDHFAHVSPTDQHQVEFTENEEKGRVDAKTLLPPSRYLLKYYPDMDDVERRALHALFEGETDVTTVHFATEQDEIEQVYVDGPESCMAHETDYYASSMHPTRVYAAGDLAIAYLRNDRGEITHRTLVWPEKKIFGRVYPDFDREPLIYALRRLGYVYSYFGFTGARLLAIEDQGEWDDEWFEGYIAPYLDVVHRADVSDDGNYLILNPKGMLNLHQQSGIAEETGPGMYRCRSCDEMSPDVGEYLTSECTECAIKNGYICCVSGRDYSLVELHDGRAIAEQYVSSHTIEDPNTGLLYLKYDDELPASLEMAA